MRIISYLSSVKRNYIARKTIKTRTRYWKRTFENYIQHRTLNDDQIQEINTFYEPYKKSIDSLYHDFYTQKTGQFHSNYISDDLYYCYIDPYYNDWTAAKYIDNKCYYRWLLSDIKQPICVAIRMNDLWYVEIAGSLVLVSVDEVVLRMMNKESFIKKATSSDGGHGVFYIDKSTSKSAILHKFSILKGDIIIQEAFIQSDVTTKLNPSSVNTIRVLSFLDERGVTIYSAIVRMGINGAKVDNASSGGITCGICDDGRLKPIAYSANGTKHFVHPDTKVSFDSIVIPGFDRIKELVKKTHIRFSHFRLLSWDFALDKNNEITLIEVNLCYGELDFHQLNNGPLFGDDTDRILREVFLSGN